MAKPSLYGWDSLKKFIEKSNQPYFKIVANDTEAKAGSALAWNYDKENQTPQDVLRDVEEYLQTIRYKGGDFIIWLCSKPRANMPEFRSLVEIPGEHVPGTHVGIGNPYGSQNVQEMINAAVSGAIEKMTFEQKIRELEKERDLLKKEVDENRPGVLERVAARFEPFLGPIISGIFEKQSAAAVAGSGSPAQQPDKPEITESEQKRAEEALQEFYNQEPEATTVLEKIVRLQKENPEMYKTAKSFLAQ